MRRLDLTKPPQPPEHGTPINELRDLGPSQALSAREREVLRLIADGLSAPAVAEQLFVSVTTVKTHLQHIYDKLGVSPRTAGLTLSVRR